MAKWTDTNAPKSGSGTEFRRMDWRNLVANGPGWKIRLVGDLLPNYLYWVKAKEGPRTRNVTNFNRMSETFDSTIDDPIKRLITPKDPKVLHQFGYATNVINRADGLIYLLELKQTVYAGILEYAKKANEGYGDPADPETGYDLTIEKKKTGPLKQNVKYGVTPSRNNTPLTEEEQVLELYNLAKLYKQETPDEQIAWLRENTLYLDINVAGDTPANGGFDPNDDVPF
jgi:hypothetical protein